MKHHSSTSPSRVSRLIVSVTMCVALLGLSGCSRQTVSMPMDDPAAVSRRFIDALVAGDADEATALSTHVLSEDDLAAIRESWTGSSDVTRVDTIEIVVSAQGPENAIVDISWLETENGIDAQRFNEAGHFLDLVPSGSVWRVDGVY